MMRLLNYIFGYHTFSVDEKDVASVLNIFMRYAIRYRFFEKNRKFCVISKDFLKAKALLCEAGINIEKHSAHGLFVLIGKYRRRVGLFAGAALFFVTVYVSGLFIWDINIEGNSNVSAMEIRQLLEKHGVCVGAYIPSLDLDSACHKALLESDSLSWMTVNMNGTSANVVVREMEKKANEVPKTPANIIAAHDGQIELVEVYDGVCHVNKGDAVREGELLIGGVMEKEGSSPKFVRASGKVFARITKKLRVEIPFEFKEKLYTGRKESEKSIIFFGKTINLSIRGGNLPEIYDKIEKEAPISLFGYFSVPVTYCETEYHEYELTLARRNETEAVKLAHRKLALMLEEETSSLELLRKDINGYFTDSSYVLECELYVIEDIARVSEFDTE